MRRKRLTRNPLCLIINKNQKELFLKVLALRAFGLLSLGIWLKDRFRHLPTDIIPRPCGLINFQEAKTSRFRAKKQATPLIVLEQIYISCILVQIITFTLILYRSKVV